MLRNIMQALLQHAIQAQRCIRIHDSGNLTMVERYLDVFPLAYIPHVRFCRNHQSQIVQDGGVQVIGNAPQILGKRRDLLAKRL